MKELSKQQKAANTMKQKYGDDYFSKLAKHGNNAYKGDSEHMSNLAKKRWEKYRNEKAQDKSTEEDRV